jgi:outer membrane protein, heavy metal efflux system
MRYVVDGIKKERHPAEPARRRSGSRLWPGQRWAICSACRFFQTLSTLAVVANLAGCAGYDPAPLPNGPDLAADLAGLDAVLPPDGASASVRKIDIARPLTIDDIGLLAILNDPDLKSERGEMGAAQAGLVEATLLPNPTAGFSYGALIGGPGTAAAVGGSLAQDIAAIVTRGARVASARAHVRQVDADLLWREWQVAQKARQLALEISSADRAMDLTRDRLQLLARDLDAVRAAVAAGNLSLGAVAPLLAAAAAAEQSLTGLGLDRLKNWQALDGLLGLVPTARFAIAPPAFQPLPTDLEPLVASLPDRRPDLAALRLGYRSAEADLRAAILGQFPAFTLGASYGSDTTGVVSAGPSLNFSLPIFDRNQGRIAAAGATRRLLREQYQARLDSAVADIHGLLAQQQRLSADLDRARRAAAAAAAIAATAGRAFAQGNLDQRSLTDYQTTALERALAVVAIERLQGEDHIVIAVELGLGLPATRIALGPRKS